LRKAPRHRGLAAGDAAGQPDTHAG
jgi:hypothetical protein